MAPRGRREDRQSWFHSRRSRSIEETPHFSRILNPEILQLGKLSIPMKFVAIYGRDLSSTVVLKVCNGDPWQIGLKERAGTMWFCKGWGKFVKKYCLREGYSLFFVYEGNSVFRVIILDNTRTEIEYPCRRTLGKRLTAKRQPTDESAGNSTEDESTDESDEASRSSSSKRKDVNSGVKNQRPRNPPRIVGDGAPRWGRTRGSSRALEAANQFPTSHPSFQVQLCEWYMRSGGMSICSDFMIKNGLMQEFEVVVLRLPGSDRMRSWAVNMFTYKTERRGKLCAGWAKFLADNSLRIGDVCIFELIGKSEFLVHIFRGSPGYGTE